MQAHLEWNVPVCPQGNVLASDKPTGGPDRTVFPLWFAISYSPIFQNVTDKPLTQLTVALTTNSSAILPEDCRLHVVYLSRLDPGESVSLPGHLFEIWSTITLCGKLRGDQIMLETIGRYQKTPAFPTFFSGTVNGEKMELKYSGPDVPDGTISLEFKRSQPN